MVYLFIKAWLGSIAPPLCDPTSGSPGEQWGALAHARQQLFTAVTLKWFLRYMLLSCGGSLLAHTLCLKYSYLQKRRLQHHIPSNYQESQVCRSVSERCSAFLFSAALLVIPFQCRMLKNTVKYSPDHGAWIYLHRISVWCSLTTSRLESQRQISYKKKISLLLNFHRNI